MAEKPGSDPGRRSRRGHESRTGQRNRVLQLVREHDGAVDAADLAARTGLHVTTVRFHLDVLCKEGAIRRINLSRPGVGRPRTGYLAVEQRVDYQMLAEVLALELGETAAERMQRAQHAGRMWARQMAESLPDGAEPGIDDGPSGVSDALDRAARMTVDVFDRMGFAPATEPPTGRQRVIRLHACPIRDLARAHRDVVCGVHLGLLQGLLTTATTATERSTTEAPALTAGLEPFVEPELCLARLTVHE